MKTERKNFNGISVRYYWDDERGEWRFAARDAVGAMASSAEPEVYWEIFVKRKERKLSSLLAKLEMAVLDGAEVETASAEELIELAAFFPEGRCRALRAFINEICTGFAYSFAPILTLDGGMLSADVSVGPLEKTVWLTVEDIAVLAGVGEDEVRSAIGRIFQDGVLSKEACSHTVISAERREVTFYSLAIVSAVLVGLESEAARLYRASLSCLAEEYIIRGFSADAERLGVLGNTLEVVSRKVQAFNGGDAEAGFYFIKAGRARAEKRYSKAKVHPDSFRITAEECAELVAYLDGELTEADMARLDNILDKVFEADDDGSERYAGAEKKAAAFLWYLVKEAVLFADELFIFFLFVNGIIGESSQFFDKITLPLLKGAVSESPCSAEESVIGTLSSLIRLSA